MIERQRQEEADNCWKIKFFICDFSLSCAPPCQLAANSLSCDLQSLNIFFCIVRDEKLNVLLFARLRTSTWDGKRSGMFAKNKLSAALLPFALKQNFYPKAIKNYL